MGAGTNSLESTRQLSGQRSKRLMCYSCFVFTSKFCVTIDYCKPLTYASLEMVEEAELNLRTAQFIHISPPGTQSCRQAITARCNSVKCTMYSKSHACQRFTVIKDASARRWSSHKILKIELVSISATESSFLHSVKVS